MLRGAGGSHVHFQLPAIKCFMSSFCHDVIVFLMFLCLDKYVKFLKDAMASDLQY